MVTIPAKDLLSWPMLEPAAARRVAGMLTKRLNGRRPEEKPMSENESTGIESTQQREDIPCYTSATGGWGSLKGVSRIRPNGGPVGARAAR